ncbi:amidohydrolase family protein [Periweissella fabaria]|uniref:N-substituted formamide deformylase n=1 Tax=Periweissella fabaria TaxID=546157 RepID=A0ABN8BFX3_9LACO|nr:amidohydrolase family protein [Periweissella fabaria]MCM0596461.1 amidohydrolase family protein [Periweissella fabaria]CAH0415811.1 N-substituted formamide deformylase [Periweissella fabaria]
MTTKYVKSNYIFDVETKKTFAGVVVIKDTKIAAILDAVPGDVTASDILDYTNQMLIPGFIDPHQHLNKASLFNAGIMNFVSGASVSEVTAKLAKVNAYHGWKIASGFYPSEFGPVPTPTKADIDQVEPTNPAVLLSGDGHTAWLNSAALAQVHVDDADVQTFGGTAYKDGSDFTGFFEEGIAVHVVAQVFAAMNIERPQLYLDYVKYMNSMGITGLADMASTGASDDDFVYEDVHAAIADEVTARVSIFPAMQMQHTRINKIKAMFADNQRVILGGGKQFYDGVTSTQTAYLKAPYPGSSTHCGEPLLPNEVLHDLIFKANQIGQPIRVHAIGDQAVHNTLIYFAAANVKYPLPAGKVNTIEHLEVFDPTDIDLIRDTKAIVSVQPSHALIEYDTLDAEVGPERSKEMFPTKDFLDAGATLAFGTDAPVVLDTTPLQSIFFATTRRTLANQVDDCFRPEQAIDTASALVAHTLNAAKAIQRQDIGAIKVGNYADLAVLDTNILDIPVTDLLQVKVSATFFNGELVFEN